MNRTHSLTVAPVWDPYKSRSTLTTHSVWTCKVHYAFRQCRIEIWWGHQEPLCGGSRRYLLWVSVKCMAVVSRRSDTPRKPCRPVRPLGDSTNCGLILHQTTSPTILCVGEPPPLFFLVTIVPPRPEPPICQGFPFSCWFWLNSSGIPPYWSYSLLAFSISRAIKSISCFDLPAT